MGPFVGLAMVLGMVLGSPLAAVSGSDLAKRQHERPLVIAHRGASHVAPENTIAALALAADLDAVAIEFDIHLSADRVPVLIHDFTLGRTTNGRGKVRETSWDELRTMDAGSWFSADFAAERIPSLEQGLRAIGENAIACIEIKPRKTMVPFVQQVLEKANRLERVIIFSFHAEQVRKSKTAMPDVPALLLVDPGVAKTYSADQVYGAAKGSGADLVGLDYRGVTESLVAHLHRNGFPVFVYTVDQPADVERMVSFGVDAIISNRPRATLGQVLRLRPNSK